MWGSVVYFYLVFVRQICSVLLVCFVLVLCLVSVVFISGFGFCGAGVCVNLLWVWLYFGCLLMVAYGCYDLEIVCLCLSVYLWLICLGLVLCLLFWILINSVVYTLCLDCSVVCFQTCSCGGSWLVVFDACGWLLVLILASVCYVVLLGLECFVCVVGVVVMTCLFSCLFRFGLYNSVVYWFCCLLFGFCAGDC